MSVSDAIGVTYGRGASFSEPELLQEVRVALQEGFTTHREVSYCLAFFQGVEQPEF